MNLNCTEKKELTDRIESLEQDIKIIKKQLDNIYFESSYSVEVLPQDVDLVFGALNKVELDYKPSIDNVCKITGLKRYRVYGILRYLINSNKVKRTFDEEGRLIYKTI